MDSIKKIVGLESKGSGRAVTENMLQTGGKRKSHYRKSKRMDGGKRKSHSRKSKRMDGGKKGGKYGGKKGGSALSTAALPFGLLGLQKFFQTRKGRKDLKRVSGKFNKTARRVTRML